MGFFCVPVPIPITPDKQHQGASRLLPSFYEPVGDEDAYGHKVKKDEDRGGRARARLARRMDRWALVALALGLLDACLRMPSWVGSRNDSARATLLDLPHLIDLASSLPITTALSAHKNLSDTCTEVPIYHDPHGDRIRRERATQGKHSAPPVVSFVYVNTGAGGYDTFFHSLASQKITQQEDFVEKFEIVCVDHLAMYRSRRVWTLAADLGLPLVAVVPPKPKSPEAVAGALQFHDYNSVNTGLLLTRGRVIVLVLKQAWLPPNFLAHTLSFYSRPKRKFSLLGYAIKSFHVEADAVQDSKGRTMPFEMWISKQRNRLTLFPENITTSLSEAKRSGAEKVSEMLVEHFPVHPPSLVDQGGLHEHPLDGEVRETDRRFYDSVVAVPWACLEKLNGVDELMDVGAGEVESDVRFRCELAGGDVSVDGDVIAEVLMAGQADAGGGGEGRGGAGGGRGGGHGAGTVGITQYDRLVEQMASIAKGERGTRSLGNAFDLAEWRKHHCYY